LAATHFFKGIALVDVPIWQEMFGNGQAQFLNLTHIEMMMAVKTLRESAVGCFEAAAIKAALHTSLVQLGNRSIHTVNVEM
jgi:hypothetical protein